ncbi:MAG: imidazole glycerol phosphate synthase subunit HisH [Betaproteobacteria bacterium HGW-Betaproteobacteria-8]|nr:MAG: imidazole glycerol phosphate synthase subunit HisH [Betaproteobacteria bacterium HGW-Betaproteobacteria-8]
MIDIAVVDYGMGNLRSVSKALEHVAPDKQVLVTSDPLQIDAAERVVFPGQGAMPDCMRELDARGLRDAVVRAAASKPFLGICIGLQLLFERSEEGDAAGLGILPGKVIKFAKDQMHDAVGHKLKVPHMGWNQVYQVMKHPMWQNIPDAERFYYVHSYYVVPRNQECIAGYSEYPARFTSAVAQDNIFAVQFHPEKSQHAGLQLLSNFAQWNGRA